MRRWSVGAVCLALALAACQGGAFRAAVSPEFLRPAPVQPSHHQLKVSIDPATHALSAEDRIELRPNGALPASVAFYLAPQLRLEAVTLGERALESRRHPPKLPQKPFDRRHYALFEQLTRYEVRVPPDQGADAPVVMTIRYNGQWSRDPQPGSSAPELLLTGESGWHPTWPDALFTFELEIDHPHGWEALSAGRLIDTTIDGFFRRTRWSMTQSTDSIDLIAGPYVVTTQTSHSIPISTYLLEDEAPLAPEYLEAAASYLERYSRLLGPYPFPKLAIVETPSPIGAAVPSITLLGQSLIRRHYTQPYALGHEIVHAWIGNRVMADETQGNWTEALTTYLANYYTVEATNGEEAARQQRRQMLIHYATWTSSETDYPLMRFLHNDSQTDAAVGYDKGAMIFHLLRRIIGDDDFFGVLRDLSEQYGGKRANWNDLRLLFEARLGRPLDWFFRQWIVQPDAPQLTIDRVEFTPLPPEMDGTEGTLIKVHLAQSTPPFRFPLTIHIETDERILEKTVWMDQPRAVIETAVATPPLRIAVDPEQHLFRRLARDELPPMLNLSLTEPSLTIVRPDRADQPFTEPYEAIATHASMRAVADEGGNGDAALLLLGGPDQNHATADLAKHLPAGVTIEPRAFTIDGHTYSDPAHALLLTVRDPARNNRPTTLLYGLSADAILPLTSTLFYHGWDSYIVFEQGRAIDKGTLPPLRSPLVWTPP